MSEEILNKHDLHYFIPDAIKDKEKSIRKRKKKKTDESEEDSNSDEEEKQKKEFFEDAPPFQENMSFYQMNLSRPLLKVLYKDILFN